VGGEIFRTCPDRPWGSPSLLYNRYRVFPGGKERPGRDADPSPLLVPLVMEEYSYTSTPPMDRTACTEPQYLYKGALFRSGYRVVLLGPNIRIMVFWTSDGSEVTVYCTCKTKSSRPIKFNAVKNDTFFSHLNLRLQKLCIYSIWQYILLFRAHSYPPCIQNTFQPFVLFPHDSL